MNPNLRNVALIAASLGLVVSLFIALREGDEELTAGTTTVATTTATTEQTTTEPPPTTNEAPPTTTAPPPPERVVTIGINVVGAQPEGGVRRASVRRGRQVVLRVTSDVADHLHLHGYDLMADVAPGAPAVIRFRATVPGRFEIELEDRRVQIADLEVRP